MFTSEQVSTKASRFWQLTSHEDTGAQIPLKTFCIESWIVNRNAVAIVQDRFPCVFEFLE